MPEQTIGLTVVVQTLENDDCLGEALFFPEVSTLGESGDDLAVLLPLYVEQIVRKLPSSELHRRRGPTDVLVEPLRVELTPSRGLAWRTPLEVSIPIVRWRHGEEAHVGCIPSLGIEVVAASEEELALLLPRHVHIAILRQKALRLDRLVWLLRVVRVEVRSQTVTIDLPSPRQVAIAQRENDQDQASVLAQVGSRLDWQGLAPAFECDEPLALLAEALAGRHPRSVLLIGPSGVGKTALVHELIRSRARFGLTGRPFWATSGARIVAGQSGFGMWQERCQALWREASKTQAILHLGNLMELLEVGKSEHQSQGLATFLRPWLARGDLLSIVEATPEQLPLIERQDPHLLRAFTPLRIAEPSSEQLEAILRRFAAATLADAGVVCPPAGLTGDGLGEIFRLHRRYAAYSANPGRPLRFLRNLVADQPVDQPITARVVTSAFSRETGLPLVLLEDSVRLDLDQTRHWFESRVIGQADAVGLVVDLLATVKTALNRPRKPIASLMFIGPTGVGKTEMAKALAEFLFGSRERLTRFDMSEYADPLAVQRLIGGIHGSEGVLTSRVREQPFSVILFDEVEKAHPQLFDLLLQVLGEGRLTDAAGRLADFCNSVVIMTSNLGAETYLQGDFGLVAEQATAKRAREHFVREVEKVVRPELFNRIDRIVPFSPLDADTTHRIAARQLELLRGRDGIRYRGVILDLSPELTAWLARKGHDPRYGARPLKRAIERELLAPLATQMNTYTADTALRVRVSLEDDVPRVQVRARTDETGQAMAVGGLGPEDVALAEGVVNLRRSLQQLLGCSAMLEVANDIYRLEKAQKRQQTHYDPRLHELTRLRDEAASALAEAVSFEDEALVTLHGNPLGGVRLEPLRGPLEQAVGRFDRLLLGLYLRQFDRPDRVSLAIFSEEPEALIDLTRAYNVTATTAGCRTSIWQFSAAPVRPEPAPAADRPAGEVPPPAPRGPERRILLQGSDAFTGKTQVQVRIWDPVRMGFIVDPVSVSTSKGIVGLGIEIHGQAVHPRYLGEEGQHQFHGSRLSSKVLVVVGNVPMPELLFPEGVERRGTIGSQPRRRVYRLEQGLVEDARLGLQNLVGRSLHEVLTHCLDQTMKLAAREVLES